MGMRGTLTQVRVTTRIQTLFIVAGTKWESASLP